MKSYSFFFLAFSLLLIIFSIRSTGPPEIINKNAPDSVFSAQRAYTYLQEISQAPHSIGTAEHARVREYIIHAFKQMGISTGTQEATVLSRYNESLVVANVSNIIARIKGVLPGKAILMVAHYDSQPNTPGAGDDGMGVASLLETARALKSIYPLQHDVMILISDAEEEGLFGAKAFVDENTSFRDIAVVVNWDFRGNSGSAVTYETSPENGWLIQQYAKGIVHPYASSMAYEVSRLLPNDADFTPFKKTGVTGFANGSLEGFVNYHSMTDKPENLDLRTVQQVGDNMLGIAKRLGNISLENTKAPDLTYFNVIGNLLIYYPSRWNLFISIAVSLLFLTGLIIGIRQKKMNLAGFITSFVALPVVCTVAIFSNGFLRDAILKFYPLYSHFYENNSYNSSWYFLTVAILSVVLFLIIFRPIYKKWGYVTTYTGILTNIVVLMWLSWIFIRSASFLFSIPCLFLSAGLLLIVTNKIKLLPGHFGYYCIKFTSALPALLLFSPLCYLLFITFGLGDQMQLVALPVVLMSALLYPVLVNLFETPRWAVSSFCLSAMILLLLTAHLNSGFDKQHPLRTNVRYRLNVNDSTADWLSDFTSTDKFSAKFFPDKKMDTTYKDGNRLIHPAPILFYQPPVLSIIKDTLYHDMREITMRCLSIREDVTAMGIFFDESSHVFQISVNGKKSKSQKQTNENPITKYLIFFGVPKEGFEVTLNMRTDSKLGMILFDRSIGLPFLKNLTEYPEDIIPGTDFNSNTVMVRKHFLL